MNLKEYFETTKGFGVLSTADKEGQVDAAVYSRPHVMDDGTIASIMRDRLSHENLKTNPHAVYLFLEEGEGYRGKRLFLTKIREEQDSELINEICRRCYPSELLVKEPRFLVVFRIDKELPLVGAGD
jgi:Pyridoxamine 5'-phosphate oxidase